MPPKAVPATNGDIVLNARNVSALCAGLRAAENLTINWKAVGDELGIGLPGNAQRAFRDAIKKMGLDHKGGKVYSLNDDAPPATPKKPSKSTKATENTKGSSGEESEKKANGCPKKRKQDAEVDIEDEAAKKVKTEKEV